MVEIIEGMTPAQFMSAVNDNFTLLAALGLAEVTTLTGVDNFLTVINGNFIAVNATLDTPISITTLAIGMSGLAFINALNDDFTDLETAFLSIEQSELYVSNSGSDDTGDGTLLAPYATLTKVSEVLLDNTKILLDKGSTFTDRLDISGKKNITIDSYGTGAKPIITGLKAVTGWSDEGGNIWSKQDNNFPDEITNVFIGSTKATLARTAGLKTATEGGDTTLVDSVLTDADGYWDNAELVIARYEWCVGIQRCTEYASKTFTLPAFYQDPTNNLLLYACAAGQKYFIQNHINCLTAQNQWAFNNVTKTLYIYSTTEPANVTATYGNDCIYANPLFHGTIQNIAIKGSAQCGINCVDSIYLNINNVTFNDCGTHSILLYGCWHVDIYENTGTDQNSDFCTLLHSRYGTVHDNVITKCGYVSGTERYTTNSFTCGMHGNGISILDCQSVDAYYNEINQVSFDGIFSVYSSPINIYKNYIRNFNLNKTDGGGIYINEGDVQWVIDSGLVYTRAGGEVYNNIIIGSKPLVKSYGIYCDMDSTLMVCHDNFITGCKSGIILYICNGNSLNSNTLFSTDSDAGIRMGLEFAKNIDHSIDGNLIVNQNTGVMSFFIDTDAVRAHTIKNNKYYYPFGKIGTGGNNTMFLLEATWMDLADWLADEARVVWTRTGETEIEPSLYAGSSKPELNFLIYLTNPAKTVRTVTAEELPYSDYLDMDGVAQTYPFTMQPYTSKVLVRPN